MGVVDVCRASVDVKDRVSAAEKLGLVLVEPNFLVVEPDSSRGMGGGSSSLSEEIFGGFFEAALTSLDFSLLL